MPRRAACHGQHKQWPVSLAYNRPRVRVRPLGIFFLAVCSAACGCAASRSATGADERHLEEGAAPSTASHDVRPDARIPAHRQPTLDELDQAFLAADADADGARAIEAIPAAERVPHVPAADPRDEAARHFADEVKAVSALIARRDPGAVEATRALRTQGAALGPEALREALQLELRAVKAQGDLAAAHVLAWEQLTACGPDGVDRCRKEALNEAARTARGAKDPRRAAAKVADARGHDGCVKRVEAAARRKGAALPECAGGAQGFYRTQKDGLMLARLQLAKALAKQKADDPGAVRELLRAEATCTEPRCTDVRRRALAALVAEHLERQHTEAALKAALADLQLHARTLVPGARPWAWTELADRACRAHDAVRGEGACRALEMRQTGGHAYFDFSQAPAKSVGLSPEQVRRVNAHYRVSLEACLAEEAARLLPPAEASYTVRWVVQNDGRVSQMKMDRHALQDAPLARCLRQQLSLWRYPKFGGELQHVEQTFGVRAAVRRR